MFWFEYLVNIGQFSVFRVQFIFEVACGVKEFKIVVSKLEFSSCE